MKTFMGETVDVCIVGSGAGGGPLAWTLAKAGAKVVILEKGPWYKREDFLDPDEITMCRRNYWKPNIKHEPRIHWHRGHSPQKTVDSWIACCVGGGTVHMSGFVHRLHPEDFEMAKRYKGLSGATLADWPISYDDLAPWYDMVEREIGVSGLAGKNPFGPPRKGPYPYPPLAENPLHSLVDAGAQKHGMHAFPTPRLVLSRDKGDRKACMHHQFCGSYGCEMGAKGSTLDSVLPAAVATGNCEVRSGAMAYQVTTRDGLAQAVRYFDQNGDVQQQKARVVVLSASSIESARLLLNSEVGNSNGMVGKNLTFSTLAMGWGEFERSKLSDALQPKHPVHFLHRSVQDTYFLKSRKGSYDKGGTLNFLLPHRNPIHTAEHVAKREKPKLWGAALMKAIQRRYNDVHEIEFEAFGEFTATPDTYVKMGKLRDQWGIPCPEVHIGQHPDDKTNSKALLDEGIAILEAAGADRVGAEAVGGITFVLQHGTCRMGHDPNTSVLDASCRSHEIKNLYVVDGSFMPSSGGVPTTLTIMANSFRVGDLLAQRFKRREIPG